MLPVQQLTFGSNVRHHIQRLFTGCRVHPPSDNAVPVLVPLAPSVFGALSSTHVEASQLSIDVIVKGQRLVGGQGLLHLFPRLINQLRATGGIPILV